VSKLLLKRWTRNGKLVAYNLRFGTHRLRYPGAEGFRRWFVKGARSESTEQLWSTVETRSPQALQAVEEGSVFEQPDHLATLKDLLALHAIRSRSLEVMWSNALERGSKSQSIAEILRMVNDPHVLAAHFHERTGLHVAGAEVLAAERERILAGLESRIGTGSEGFATSLAEQFATLRDYLGPRGFDIGVVDDGELLVADNPAVTSDSETGRVGFLGGATIGQSDWFVLPVGPHHVVAAGGSNAYVDLSRDSAERLNMHQIRVAHERVYFCPDGELLEWVERARRRLLDADGAASDSPE
jgi:hypothetical protein